MTVGPNYLRIAPGDEVPALEQFRWFRAVVVIDREYSVEWQDEISRWLVDGGCLYMMAWGPGCISWDDSVDHAQIAKFAPQEAPDEEFIMTTWHANESLESVFWYSQFCAHDPYDRIGHTLIIHISSINKESELLTLFKRSADLADRES